MIRVATLGPAGTYSDTATEKYAQAHLDDYAIRYYSSIKKALSAIGADCDLGVLPIENLSEGFVAVVLDHLINSPLYVVDEVIIPIEFSLIANCQSVDDIEHLFVQFVAKGQCSEFIDSLSEPNIIATESNIESLQTVRDNIGNIAAIVPSNAVKKGEFPLIIDQVNDFKHNQTRFLVFSNQPSKRSVQSEQNIKTSVLIFDDYDRPGVLESILSSFSKRAINLVSIVSRPTRRKFGTYHFFIDFEGHTGDERVQAALAEIAKDNRVQVMGSYPQATPLTADN